MDTEPTQQDFVENGQPAHYEDDISKVRKHDCRFIQRGNYAECEGGHHGFAVPMGKMIDYDDKGRLQIVDINVRKG
jgi:hypothetical protein